MNHKIKKQIESFLLKVNKPARYFGGELNTVVKNEVDLRIALSYPDLYEIGMANHGIKILYDKVNNLDNIACERVFAVATDFSAELINRNIPLYSLETFTPLCDLDLIGFNVAHQMLYTNILYILELGQINPLKCERSNDAPIIIAGGEAVSNPAPLEDFIDAFFLGDGEEGIIQIVKTLKNLKLKNVSRFEKIKLLSEIEGVFVPEIYEKKIKNNISYYSGKEIKKIKLDKDVISDPLKPIISNMRITQERAIATLTRGCFNLCKFCHAGYYNLPYRAVKPDKIAKRILDILKNSGYNELSLSSLSISDYRYLVNLLNLILPELIAKGIKISLPSLKVDKNSIPIIEAISKTRKTSLTFAVETANEEIRKIIHKRLTLDELMEIINIVYSKGWRKIKLYFMIGLPGYRENDEIESIIDLLKKINSIAGNKIKLNVTISPFVPKPHTPFERYEMANREYFEKAVKMIRQNVTRNVSIKNHNIDTSILEGFFSRADNRCGKVIFSAYKKGCILDSWDEFFKPEIWYNALNTILPDWKKYFMPYKDEDILPWSIIKTGYEKIKNLNCKKVLSRVDLLKLKSKYTETMNLNEIKKAQEKFDIKYNLYKKIRIVYSKSDSAKYISHLDIIEVFIRAFRMVELPVCFSQGFHKREKFSTGFPLPLGIESVSEVMDIDLYENIDPETVLNKLNQVLPLGINILDIFFIDKKQSLMNKISAIEFIITIPDKKIFNSFLKSVENNKILQRKAKNEIIHIPAKEVIRKLEIFENNIQILIPIGIKNSIRIDNLILQLTDCDIYDLTNFKIQKIAQFCKNENDNYLDILKHYD